MLKRLASIKLRWVWLNLVVFSLLIAFTLGEGPPAGGGAQLTPAQLGDVAEVGTNLATYLCLAAAALRWLVKAVGSKPESPGVYSGKGSLGSS
jgi:hypothetical protein